MIKHLIILFAVTVLAACTVPDKPELVENSGYAQGSTYQIKYLTTQKLNFDTQIEQILKRIDESMSTYVPTSLISQINKGAVKVKVDSLFLDVLKRSIDIANETDGDFDPTIGPLVRLWGFDYEKIRQDVTNEMIHETQNKTGYKNIIFEGDSVWIPAGFSLDFNAIAQGYTVDVISEYLEKQGIEHYMVEVGGEVRTSGVNERGNVWRIGVDKPQDEIDTQDRFQFILELNNAALATSGNYRKFWVDEQTGNKYAHTIHPHTGKPAKNTLLSVSMITDKAMDADAYATVCMVKGLEKCKDFLASRDDLHAYLIYASPEGDWEVFITEGFEEFIVKD